MHFYTSINSNYLPKARVLAESVKKYCPQSRFSLVFADEIPEEFHLENENFDEILLPEDLGIPDLRAYRGRAVHRNQRAGACKVPGRRL